MELHCLIQYQECAFTCTCMLKASGVIDLYKTHTKED